jgi:pyruvate dehydrogenase E2 component (dihydrolipoamide acetyltransferase)
MPALGMAQETGTLLQWLKSEGDEVSKGEPLMEIETDKTTVEVEATASGTLTNVTAGPGDEIPVGQVIALILAPGETAPQTSAVLETAEVLTPATTEIEATDQAEILASPLAARIAAEHKVDLKLVKPTGERIKKEDVLAYLATQPASDAAASVAAAASAASPANGRVLASPKARRLAREENLNLATLNGSGPGGAVLAADVLAAATPAVQPALSPIPAPASTPPVEPQIMPISRMWQIMAQRLTESWNSVPHFYLVREANASRLMAWRERAQQRSPEKLTYTDLIVKLVAAALRKHPRVNAKWVDGAIIANDEVNVGLAVAVEEGLLVPVIHRADQLGLAELAARRKDLVTRAQAKKLSPDDMSDGTFTISNLGMYGVDTFSAIVNPPQAAILALGRIADRVVPVNGQPAVQPMIVMTLSCDHRVVDGARAAQFLQTLTSFIEDPLGVLD